MRRVLAFCLAACGGSSAVKDAKVKDAAPDAAPAGPTVVYVGAGDGTIRTFALDPMSLALDPHGSTTTLGGPSFLAVDRERRWLVAVNESNDTVESFRIGEAGVLAQVDSQSSLGGGPAHVSVDGTSKWALVANYGGGTIAALPVAADGTFGTASGPLVTGANAHQIITNAANTIAYVPCKGADRIEIYGFDATTGALTARTPVATTAGAGPRHLAFHPSGDFAFVVNENDSTITSYTVEANGNLVKLETVTTLPPGFSGTNTGAEIAVHRSGRAVFASNRGDDSIVRYAFDPSTRKLTDPRHTETFGMKPRHFSLLLGDTAMLVANQASGSIHAFRVADDGMVSPVGEVATVTGATFVGAVTFP